VILRLFGGRKPRARRVLAFVDLPQDVEALRPVLTRLSDAIELKVAVSRWLRVDHPDSLATLTAAGVRFDFVRRSEAIAGRAPGLRGIDALLTASESSHLAHTAGYALARRARDLGIATYTLQHGLENVGVIGPEAARYDLASERVFCWFPPEMAAAAPDAVRARLVHVGRPRAPGGEDGPVRYDVGVFENLHAERYGEAARTAFIAGLEALAATGASVLLRPHPAGRWSAGLDLGRWPNLTLDASGGVQAAVGSVRRVITTPSTVVLDAAQTGRPVAMAGDGGPLYRPFPVLETADAWAAFGASADGQAAERRAFLDRVLVSGDAAGRIAQVIEDDLSRRLARR
jgi:hypothetical protein